MRRPVGVTTQRLAAPVVLAVLLLVSACSPVEVRLDPTVEFEVVEEAEMAEGAEMTVAVQGEAISVADHAVRGLNGGSAAVPVRVYTPAATEVPWATLVWAHGGSFMRGTLDWPEADWVSRRFAETGVRVISVDYVLASDTVKAPAPSIDVAAAVLWAGDTFAGPLIVGGASAGAHLAVLATLDQADMAPARSADALILQYPTLHRMQRVDEALAAAAEELPEERRFRADRIAEMYDFYLGDSGAPVAGELPLERLAALPPVVIVNADIDELRASGEEFADQLRSAGVTVSEAVQPGTVHGYMNRPEESDRARQDALATIERFVTELRRLL